MPKPRRTTNGNTSPLTRSAPVSALSSGDARVLTTLERADALCVQGQPAMARALIERSLRRRVREGEAAPSTLLCAVARTHLAEGDVDAALSCLDAALASAELADDPAGIGAALNGQAGVLLHGAHALAA
ncbi:MAG: hypothetical protein ACXW61_06285, partial [Gemmatirosa sp.]